MNKNLWNKSSIWFLLITIFIYTSQRNLKAILLNESQVIQPIPINGSNSSSLNKDNSNTILAVAKPLNSTLPANGTQTNNTISKILENSTIQIFNKTSQNETIKNSSIIIDKQKTQAVKIGNISGNPEKPNNTSTNQTKKNPDNLTLPFTTNIPLLDVPLKIVNAGINTILSIAGVSQTYQCEVDPVGPRQLDGDNSSNVSEVVNPITMSYDDYLLNYKDSLAFKDLFREEVYYTNLKKINAHNRQENRTYDMGLNQFTDFQEKQFQQQYYGLVIPPEMMNQPIPYDNQQPPNINIDWGCKASNIITQGKCGACYIMAALDSIEITMRMYNQTAFPLSVQQILSCGNNQGLKGCIGGYFKAVFDYVQTKGVGAYSIYPYDGAALYQGVTSKCNNATLNNPTYTKNRVVIRSSKQIPYGDCYSLVNQLRFRAIAVAISADGMQFYKKGTFTTDNTTLNHGVTLVGYDPIKGYKIKNSWGITWGTRGFGYISNTTGICNFAMAPELVVETGTPQSCC